jgi:hypothetical protein
MTIKLRRASNDRYVVAATAALWRGGPGARTQHRRVLIGKFSLEGHHDMAAVLHVIGDALEERIVLDIKRGNNQ